MACVGFPLGTLPPMRWLTSAETAELKPTAHPGVAVDAQGKFWFWDETGTQACGPFDSLRDALTGIEAYCRELG